MTDDEMVLEARRELKAQRRNQLARERLMRGDAGFLKDLKDDWEPLAFAISQSRAIERNPDDEREWK